MKKMKKLLAMSLAMSMVLGMSMTTMASEIEAVNIPIHNAGSDAKFAKLQMIEPSTTTDTGWTFSDTAIASAYKTAFGITDDTTSDADEQKAIWMLIKNQDEKDGTEDVQYPFEFDAAEDSDIADALAAVKDAYEFTDHVLAANLIAETAGVYYIDGVETNFNYSPMAAYVSFGYTKGVPTSLACAGVEAKRVPETITKDATSVEGYDEITEIGRPETYTLTSTVPYLPATDSNRTYQIIDELKGATYVSTTTGKVDVTVTAGTFNKSYTLDVTPIDGGKTSFTLDLSTDLLKDAEGKAANPYANKVLTVTYQATVTDTIVENDVYAGDGTNDGKDKYGSSNEDLFTGKITLTKYDEGTTPLAGATFNVYKLDGTEKVWATFGADGKFTGWVEAEYEDDATGLEIAAAKKAAEEAATEVTTGADGTLTVSGLDSGTYYFKETVAPAGYSINEEDVDATLALADGVKEATAVLEATTSMNDTKLIALPSTGGIGTTIFTFAGCGIMIAAAYLFFANKRREEA